MISGCCRPPPGMACQSAPRPDRGDHDPPVTPDEGEARLAPTGSRSARGLVAGGRLAAEHRGQLKGPPLAALGAGGRLLLEPVVLLHRDRHVESPVAALALELVYSHGLHLLVGK